MDGKIYAVAHVDSGIGPEDITINPLRAFQFVRVHFGANNIKELESPFNGNWLSSDLRLAAEDGVIDFQKYKDRIVASYKSYKKLHIHDSIPGYFYLYEIKFYNDIFDVFTTPENDTLLTVPALVADFGRYVSTRYMSKNKAIIKWDNPRYRVLKILDYHAP